MVSAGMKFAIQICVINRRKPVAPKGRQALLFLPRDQMSVLNGRSPIGKIVQSRVVNPFRNQGVANPKYSFTSP
jgi:hypothetical protein